MGIHLYHLGMEHQEMGGSSRKERWKGVESEGGGGFEDGGWNEGTLFYYCVFKLELSPLVLAMFFLCFGLFSFAVCLW